MTYRAAIIRILADRAPDEAHWTVVWDEALRRGDVDPVTDPDARTTFLRDLAEAAREGAIQKTSTGTYRSPSGGG